MQKDIEHKAQGYAARHGRHKLWCRVVSVLACVAIFVTTYMLILPGITMEQTAYCGLEEHSHDASCYETQLTCTLAETEDAGENETGEEAHSHTDDCYAEVLTCRQEEHEHTLACYSDASADVETAKDWEQTLEAVERTGVPAADLVAVAKSQLGYAESTRNYAVEDDQKKGYTRYGDWFGDAYGDWSAMFAAFCLHYAKVDYPTDGDCNSWMEALRTAPRDDLRMAADETPAAGDLAFLDLDGDDTADHIGIITAVPEDEADASDLRMIVGDAEDCVQYESYPSGAAEILAYGKLPTEETEPGQKNEPDAVQPDTANSITTNAKDKPSSGGTDEVGLTPVEAPDYIGSIPSTNNGWQITKEKYTDREQSNKIAMDGDNDGETAVYLQKNVVPTDTENEFLVYLSMDKKMTWKTFFDNSGFGVTTSNGTNPGKFVSSINGKSTAIGAHGEYGTHQYVIELTVYQKRGDTTPLYTYKDVRYGASPNCSHGSVWMTIPGVSGYLILRNNTTLKADGGGQGDIMQLPLYLDDALKDDDFSFSDTIFDKVTDTMGEYMEFQEIVKSDGDASFDTATNTLTWIPEDNETVVSGVTQTGSALSGWNNNITQLVYRVRLRVEQENFASCGDTLSSTANSISKGESYAVNQQASLTFHKEALENATGTTGESLTVQYPVPEVRGLLYNISFEKRSETGKELRGAVFALYQEDGTTPVKDADGNDYTVTTVAGQTSKFTDLPYGEYILKEVKAPPHYNASRIEWSVPLCYTTNSNVLKQDSTDLQKLRYTGQDGNSGKWIITNSKGEYTYKVSVQKTDNAKNPLQGAVFTLTNPDATAEPLRSTTDEKGAISFNAVFRTGVIYTLSEVETPDGYQPLPADIQFKVVEDTATDTATAELVNAADLNNLVGLTLEETDGESVLTIHVINRPGYELPETGGSGVRFLYAGGSGLLALALWLAWRKRRQERNG